jgi:hypothetical protein
MVQEQAGIYIPTKDMSKHVEAPQNTKAAKHYWGFSPPGYTTNLSKGSNLQPQTTNISQNIRFMLMYWTEPSSQFSI